MVETDFVMIETGIAVTTETAAIILAMTAIVVTKEIGGTTAIAAMTGINAMTAISVAIGTGGVAMEARVTTIAAAWRERIRHGARIRTG